MLPLPHLVSYENIIKILILKNPLLLNIFVLVPKPEIQQHNKISS